MAGTEVIYNGECPICAREIAGYRRLAEADAAPVAFTDLNATDLSRLGLSPEDATRRLHVVRDGQIVAGFPAFLALWAELPRLRWMARLFGLPGVRPLAGAAYERIAAPLLYALHRRRRARALHKAPRGR